MRYQNAADIRTDLERLKRDTESNRIAATEASLENAPKDGKLWGVLAVTDRPIKKIVTAIATLFFWARWLRELSTIGVSLLVALIFWQYCRS